MPTILPPHFLPHRLRRAVGLRTSWIVVAAVVALLGWVPAASALTQVIVPNAEHAAGGTNLTKWTGSVGCSNDYTCINEGATTNDANYLYLNPTLGTTIRRWDLSTFSMPAGWRIHSISGFIKGALSGSTGSCNLNDLQIKLANDTSLMTTATHQFGIGFPAVTTDPLDNWTVSTTTPLELTQADLDGLLYHVDIDACSSMTHYVINGYATITYMPPNISGTVSDTSICNGVTPVIGVAVDNVLQNTVPCAAGTGYYEDYQAWASDTVVTTFINGQTSKGSFTTRTGQDSGTALPNRDIVTNQVRVGSVNGGAAVGMTELAYWDSVNDADVQVNANASPITVLGTSKLVIMSGMMSPYPNDVTTPSIWVRTGATYDGSGSGELLTITGSGTGACDNTTALRPYCNVGGASFGTGGVSFRSTANTVFGPASSTAASYGVLDITTNATVDFRPEGTINASSLTITPTSAAPMLDTSTYSPTINVTGVVTLNAGAILGGSGTGTITIGGNFTGAGTVNLTGGTVDLRSSGAAQSLSNSANTWQFATLRLTNSHATTARTVTVPAAARSIRASTLLQVGSATDTSNTTLTTTAQTQPMNFGDVTITNRGTMSVPTNTAPVTVNGDFTNSGTFTQGTSLITFAGASPSTITGTLTFYRVSSTVAGKVLVLANNITISNALTLTGGGCNSALALRSDTPSTQRTITNTGMTASMTWTGFQDIRFTTAVTPTNAADMGGNLGINFGAATACATAPSALYTDTTNAQSGATQPSNVNGRGAFHQSFVNSTGIDVDRYRTEIWSSPLDASVRGLFALDGNGTDRSALANTATVFGGVGFTAGATNFSQAATFDGVDDIISAPSNAAYSTTTFTVETWFRASTLTNAIPVMVSRSNGVQTQFALGFDTATKVLQAQLTSSGGGAMVSTPSAPWLDNTWHHAAITVNGSNELRLFVDGVQLGGTQTFAGTLHMPAGAILIGSGNNTGYYFNGALDDVQFSNVAKTQPELAGYVATKRPHAQSIWQSANFSTTGAALSASCTTATRCADVAYGGSDIHLDGARYYASHQNRTVAGYWSPATTDWFVTSDQITVTAPGSVPITAAGSTDGTTFFDATTTCTSGTGCNLYATAPSETVGLLNAAGTIAIPPITPSSPSAPGAWAAGSPLGLGFTVLSSTSGKNTGRWGTGVNFSNLALLNFVGLTRTNSLIQNMPSGTETTRIGVRVNANVVPGSYSGSLDLVALVGP